MLFVRRAEQENYLDIAIIHFASWKSAHENLFPESYVNAENMLSAKIKMWKNILLHPKITVLIAYSTHENKDKIVGFISYFNIGRHYEITTLYVLPEYHKSGIGTQLMEDASKDILQATPNPRLSFWILKENTTTIRVATEYGFEFSGETSEVSYEGLTITDVKMVKILGETA